MGNPPPGATDIDIPVIASIDLPIQDAGAHTMRVDLDGKLRAELTLHVRIGTPSMPLNGMVS